MNQATSRLSGLGGPVTMSGGAYCYSHTLYFCVCGFVPQEKHNSLNSEPAALCVAVNGNYAAVGYQGRGIKVFSLHSSLYMFHEK